VNYSIKFFCQYLISEYSVKHTKTKFQCNQILKYIDEKKSCTFKDISKTDGIVCFWDQQCQDRNNAKHTSRYNHPNRKLCQHDKKCERKTRYEVKRDVPRKCQYGTQCKSIRDDRHTRLYTA